MFCLLQSGSLIGLAAYLLSYQAAPAAVQRKGVRRSHTDVQAATVLNLVQAYFGINEFRAS
jgi:hypothetical protein